MTIYTTLNKIKQHNPCPDGWDKLLKFLNKTEADDEPLNLLTILESNGAHDCVWAFRTTEDCPVYRLIAADFAGSVLHIFEEKYPDDNRPRLAIQSARDYANVLISEEKLDAAWAAAWDAAWVAARCAARDAARGAARDSDRFAAWAAAWAAELEKQRQVILNHLS